MGFDMCSIVIEMLAYISRQQTEQYKYFVFIELFNNKLKKIHTLFQVYF